MFGPIIRGIPGDRAEFFVAGPHFAIGIACATPESSPIATVSQAYQVAAVTVFGGIIGLPSRVLLR